MPPALRLSLFYAAFFLGWGCVLPYWPVWYAERGLPPELIGVAGGVGLLARMLVSPFAAFWSDGVRRAKDPLIALAWLTLAFWIAHIPAREPWMLIGLAFLTGAALYPVIPLSDSLAFREARAGGFAFGPVRAVGSGAFIAANLAAGALVGWLGGEAMLGWMLGMTLLLGLMGFLLPPGLRQGEALPARARLAELGELLRRPDFLLAIVASGLITGSHAFYYSFSALAWRAEGMETAVVGALWAFAVAAEVVFLALSAKLAARVNPLALIVLGGAAACVRWLAYAADPAMAVLFGLQLLHALSFGATYLGYTMHVGALAGERRLAVAFALNSAVAGGAFSALFVALSGWLFARFGLPGFAAMAAPASLGALCAGGLMILMARRGRTQPQRSEDGGAMDAPR